METWQIVYLLTNFVSVMAVERLMGVFFEERETPFFTFALSLLVAYVLTSASFIFGLYEPLAFLVYFVSVLIITMNYKTVMIRRVVVVFACFIAAFTVEIFGMLLIVNMYQFHLFDKPDVNPISGFIFYAVISYGLACMLRGFKNIRKNSAGSYKLLFMYICIAMTLAGMLFIISFYLPRYAAITATLMTAGISIFILYLHDTLSAEYQDKLQSELNSQEKEYYYLQCQLMQESVERIKALRHDMKLHLTAAAEYNANGKTFELSAYLQQLLGNVNAHKVHSETGHIAFDSIINFKLKNAAALNIQTDINLFIPHDLPVEVADIVTILGNLLDNALEAVASIPNKYIKLTIEASKGNLIIKMDNTFDGLLNEHLATRKFGDQHGYGLKNIRTTAEKYNGHVDISYEGCLFSIAVLLYLNG